eukprot:m.193317 g.193317  ORF g.193317 m.193317 type:complete len:553 (+) comp18631_c1_seq1:103-1761(+)
MNACCCTLLSFNSWVWESCGSSTNYLIFYPTRMQVLGDTVKDDYPNIALLTLLYTLQGIPMGFSAAVPLILKEREASFSDIALFSASYLPFSAKLFWAPMVDSMYLPSIGRRKTWMVPAQLAIGMTLMFIAYKLPEWLGEGKDHVIQIVPLTLVFFFLYLLCATQDIAVDGWALTMLRKENVGYASTCNTIGQTVGYFEAFVLIIALVETGYVSFSAFTMFHGAVFIFVTLGVWMFKHESPPRPEEEIEGVSTVYKQMAQISQLTCVKELIIVLLTWKFSAGIADNVTVLKIQEIGMPKEHAATLSLLQTPVQIVIPMVVAKYTGGPYPLELAVKSYIPRTVLAAIAGLGLVYYAPAALFAALQTGEATLWDLLPYYTVLFLVTTAYSVFAANMFVSQMAFFAKVSDPAIGGTYMTLLNTVANLGSLLTKQVVTYGVDYTTVKSCTSGSATAQADAFASLTCPIAHDVENPCELGGGTCVTTIDGYYVMTYACLGLGILWWWQFRPLLESLQTRPVEGWRVSGSSYSVIPLGILFLIVFGMMVPTINRVLHM